MLQANKFSLIELLIIIAVMLVLISLLQPSLVKMISMAHTTKCLSNESQMGTALTLYTEDNNSYYPTLRSWVALSGIKGQSTRYGSHIFDEHDRMLNPYLNSVETSHCPADRGDALHPDSAPDSCYEGYGTSYLPAAYGRHISINPLFRRNDSTNLSELDRPHKNCSS